MDIFILDKVLSLFPPPPPPSPPLTIVNSEVTELARLLCYSDAGVVGFVPKLTLVSMAVTTSVYFTLPP